MRSANTLNILVDRSVRQGANVQKAHEVTHVVAQQHITKLFCDCFLGFPPS
jgi:hypothetical protein